jgi:hypothetical protein
MRSCTIGRAAHLGHATTDGGVLVEVDVGALITVVPPAAVEHDAGLKGLETALEGLDLAHLVVLLDVLLPEVGAKLHTCLRPRVSNHIILVVTSLFTSLVKCGVQNCKHLHPSSSHQRLCTCACTFVCVCVCVYVCVYVYVYVYVYVWGGMCGCLACDREVFCGHLLVVLGLVGAANSLEDLGLELVVLLEV